MRGWAGDDPPGIAYVYESDLTHRRPRANLETFSGVLHCDGYEAYARITEKRPVRLPLCWVNVRRKFFEIASPGAAPIAEEMLRRNRGLSTARGSRENGGCKSGRTAVGGTPAAIVV
jgi:transposase